MQTNKRTVLWVGIGGLLCLSVFRLWKRRWNRRGERPHIQDKDRTVAIPRIETVNGGEQKCHVHFTTNAPTIINANDDDENCESWENEERQIDDADLRADRERFSREKEERSMKETSCSHSNRDRSCICDSSVCLFVRLQVHDGTHGIVFLDCHRVEPHLPPMSGLFSGVAGGSFPGSGISPFGMTTSPFKAVQASSAQKREDAADAGKGKNGDGEKHATQTSSNPFSFSGTQSTSPFSALSLQSNPSTTLGEVMGEKKEVDWSDAHIPLSKETMMVVNGQCELNPALVTKYSDLH